MSNKTNTTDKALAKKFEKLIGPTVKSEDNEAREKLISARVKMLIINGFFGNLSTNLKLTNADEWCSTAATDGRRFYYNSRFINMLQPGEVEFLMGHEVLHVVYDHLGRRDDRNMHIWNIANDYAVNADLKTHKVGTFITTVPCLYDSKYENKSSEEIYEDLMANAKKIDLDSLLNKMIDEHLDDNSEEESEGKGPEPMTAEERNQLRQDIKAQLIEATKNAKPGSVPLGIQRLVKKITEPKMNWRQLIQTNLTSVIRTDYSFSRPNRRSWHIDAVLPGMSPGEEIDICVAIDMSGSIMNEQAALFLSAIEQIMQSFTGYKIHVFCFDTEIYNPVDFDSDNLDTIDTYEPMGGGGTDFDCIFNYLKNCGKDPKRLIVFTDGYPYGSWGDPNFTDVTWIVHGNSNPNPPFGTWALFEDNTK